MRYWRLAPMALAALTLMSAASSTMTMAQSSGQPLMRSTYSPTFSSGYNITTGYSSFNYYSSGWTNWRAGADTNTSCLGWRRLLCGDFSLPQKPAQPKEAGAQ